MPKAPKMKLVIHLLRESFCTLSKITWGNVNYLPNNRVIVAY